MKRTELNASDSFISSDKVEKTIPESENPSF